MAGEGPRQSFVAGDVVGKRFEVQRELGRGGMGVVFAARAIDDGAPVALKVLLPTPNQPRAVARFEREISMAMQLVGEHVVKVLDAGCEGDMPFLVMEYLEGVDLKQLLMREGRLSCDDAVGYTVQACAGLAEAHAMAMVHRDLKPANLFLTTRADGRPVVKVLDFGVAKLVDEQTHDSLTQSAASVGTPMYMAPEQIRDAKRVDARADVWAIGVVLFELWTGTTPFVADTPQGLLASILSDEPRSIVDVRPDTHPVLANVVNGCLRRNPDKRFSSVGAVVGALAPLTPAWAKDAANIAFVASVPAPLAMARDPSEQLTITSTSEGIGHTDGFRAATSAQAEGPSGPSPTARGRIGAFVVATVVAAAMLVASRQRTTALDVGPARSAPPRASESGASSAFSPPSLPSPSVASNDAPAVVAPSSAPSTLVSAPTANGPKPAVGTPRPPTRAKVSVERVIDTRD